MATNEFYTFNYQDYAQKPQRNCTFMNSASVHYARENSWQLPFVNHNATVEIKRPGNHEGNSRGRLKKVMSSLNLYLCISCKREPEFVKLRSPGTISKESIPQAYVA